MRDDGVDFYLEPKYLGGSEIKSDDVVIDFIKNYPCDIVVWQNPIALLTRNKRYTAMYRLFLISRLRCTFYYKKRTIQTIFKKINLLILSTMGKFEQTQNLEPLFIHLSFF